MNPLPVSASTLGQRVPGLGPWASARYEHHRRLSSTNDRAKELAREGAPDGTIVRADEQTAGRGRRGKSWQSPAGVGVWCSIVVRPDMPPGQWSRLIGWASLAVLKTVKQFTGNPAGVKWPNDVLVGGRKIAGILLEADAGTGRSPFAVVGIGVNVNQSLDDFAPEWRGEAVSLRLAREACGEGGVLDPEAVFQALVRQLEATYVREARHRFQKVFDRLRPHSLTLGRPVRVMGEQEDFTGIAVDFTPDGPLVVIDDRGNRRIVHAGDVSIRPGWRRNEAHGQGKQS